MSSLKIIFTLFTVILLSERSYCAQQNTQVLSMGLPQIMSIEKVMVENVEYNRDDPLPNMRVKETKETDPNNTFLRLSPMKVQIHTNSSTPLIVNAQFKELKHKDGLYNFNPSNLMVEPKSYTINNPFDHVVTGIFTPVVDVKPDTAMGMYRGSIFFTLGAI